MELLILGLVKLIGSAGFGTMFGGIMGLFNRKADLDLKRLEREEAKDRMAHELAMRDKDAAIMAQEWIGRERVAVAEGDAMVEREAFSALAKSYDFAKPAPGSRMESFSAFMRPFMSGGYFIVSTIGCGWIVYFAFAIRGVKFTDAQWFDLVMFVLAWFFFMAGSAVGWWYAMRPGGKAPMLATR